LLVRLLVAKIRVPAVRLFDLPMVVVQRSLLLVSWFVIASIISFGGLKYLNFDFSLVYDFRNDAAKILPSIYGYISSLTSSLLLPFSFLLAYVRKNRVEALMAMAGSLMMMGLTAHKGPVFYPFAVLSLYLILEQKNTMLVLLAAYIGLVVCSIVGYMMGPPYDWIGNLTLRRFYIMPALLNFQYFDFFSSGTFTLWSESKVSFGLVERPYLLNTPNIIGWHYYGNVRTAANTGWVGSGYANAGYLGMLLYAIIIGLLLSLLDAYRKFFDKTLIVAISLGPILVLMVSSDLPSSFLNHGVILLLLLFSMSERQKKPSIGCNSG
jgi:hypothetical protein